MENLTRYEIAKRLRDSGMTFKEVGINLDVSATRARAMFLRQQRIDDYKKMVPWHWHDGLSINAVIELGRAGIDNRDKCMVLSADNLTVRGKRVIVIINDGRLEIVRRSRWKYLDLNEYRISLETVNEVRSWLGVPDFVPPVRVASKSELERARRLLDRHGHIVVPPKSDTADGA